MLKHHTIVICLLFCAVLSSRTFAADSKLAVSYTFAEGEGEVLHDDSGNNHHGKIVGATWGRNGQRWALEFDGVDDFVNCGDVHPVGPQTVTTWVYAEPIYSVWLGVPIVDNGSFQIKQHVSDVRAGPRGFLPAKKWVHVAVVWDNETVRLYVDGTMENLVAAAAPQASTEDLLLCGPRSSQERADYGDTPAYDRRFKGKIASLRIYNRALTHDEVLQDLRTSNITGCPMSMSIPQPGLGRIKTEVDAARLGSPNQDVVVTVQVFGVDEAGGEALAVAVVNEFDEMGRAVIDLDTPSLPQGDFIVRTTARDRAGKTIGAPGEERLAWAGSVTFPSGAAGARKLNNLVTELLQVTGSDDSGAAYRFVNPRKGFVYISNRGSKEVTITPTGTTQAMKVLLSQDYGDSFEAQRYLPQGEYTITAPLAQDLIVRAVAQTVYDYANPEIIYVKGFGPYHGEFEARYVFPHNNTFLVQEPDIDKPFARDLKDKGRRLLAHGAAYATPEEGQTPVDALCKMLSEGAGFSHPLYDGYLADEFSASNEGHWLWVEALNQLLTQPRYKGRVVHAWTYALYDLVTYEGGEPGRAFVQALQKHDSPVQWECYLQSRRTELAAWRHIHDKVVDEMLATEAASPGIVKNLIVAPYAYVTAGPPWLTMTLPGYDTRTFLEMQVRTIATDPAFVGVRGLGVYRSPYADEETTRWMARLFRHYAIEGNTEPLGLDPLILTHIRDGDFEQPEQKWWNLNSAEQGSIRFDLHPGLGSLQSRYTGRNGDAVLITRRSPTGPNVFSQEIKNLEPRRLYSFRMFTADHIDRTSPHPHGVNVQFDNAELLPDKSFTHLAATKGFTDEFLNWHVRVFRAKDRTAVLRISDWATENDPGGPFGQELMYNFIKVQPYWPPD